MSIEYDDPTDVTDEHGKLLQPLLPERTWRPSGPGRPPCDVRRMLNGILSLNKTGGQWRLVPRALGHWSTIDGYCKRWRRDGVWARVMETLRQWERRWLGRQPEPSAGRMDSQRIKTATQREDLGFDGHKKIKGCTRHILVDTLGLIMAVVVTSADTDDRLGWVEWLSQYCAEGVKRLRKIWVDGAYPAEWLEAWVRGLKPTHTIDWEATTNQEGKGFQVLPWRWAVERTFAWLLNDRRHRRDYERLTATSVAMIQMSMIRLLLNRWA
jgi:putative transposase